MRPRLSATEASLDRLNELASRSVGDKSSHIGGGGGNDLVLNALPVWFYFAPTHKDKNPKKAQLGSEQALE